MTTQASETVCVPKEDLLAAWSVLETLTVSLNRIGSAFAKKKGATNGADLRRSAIEALDAYLTPQRIQEVNNARLKLARYLPEDELENLAENELRYWTHAAQA